MLRVNRQSGMLTGKNSAHLKFTTQVHKKGTPADLQTDKNKQTWQHCRCNCTCISCVKPSKSTVTPCALASSCVISNGKPYVSYSTNASRPLTLGLLPFVPFDCLAAACAQYTILLTYRITAGVKRKAAIIGHSAQNDEAKVQVRECTTNEP